MPLVVLLAVGALLAGLLSAVLSVAAGAADSGRSWPAQELTTSTGGAAITSISCPGPGCIGIGVATEQPTGEDCGPTPMPAAFMNVGTDQKIDLLPLPTNANNCVQEGGPDSISCPSSDFCAVGGSYLVGEGLQPFLDFWVDGAWVGQALPPTNADGINDIACQDALNCVAILQAGDLTFTIETLTNGSWTTSAFPVPAGRSGYQFADELSHLSCWTGPSGLTCTAGLTDAGSPHWTVYVISLSNGVWTSTPLPAPADLTPSGSWDLQQLSCLASGGGSCIGAGSYESTSNGERGFVARFDGGVWTDFPMPLPADAATGASVEIGGFSNDASGSVCTSDETCFVTGSYATKTNTRQNFLYQYALGGGTSIQLPLPADASGEGSELTAISCSADNRCNAGGNYFNTKGNTPYGDQNPFVDVWDGTSWAPNAIALPSDAVASITTGFVPNLPTVTGTGCPSGGPCIATGPYVVGDGSTNAAYVTNDGTGSTTAPPSSSPPESSGPSSGPVLTQTPAGPLNPSRNTSFQISASDPAGDPIQITWAGLPTSPTKVTCPKVKGSSSLPTVTCKLSSTGPDPLVEGVTFTATDTRTGSSNSTRVEIDPAVDAGASLVVNGGPGTITTSFGLTETCPTGYTPAEPYFYEETLGGKTTSPVGKGADLVYESDVLATAGRTRALTVKAGADLDQADVLVKAVCSGGGHRLYGAAHVIPLVNNSFVVLGDSYSAGEGNRPFTRDTDLNPSGTTATGCHRSSTGWAYKVAAAAGYANPTKTTDEPFAWTHAACSGADLPDLTAPNRGYAKYGESEVAQLDAVTSATKTVAMTDGGNDVGFSKILSACAVGLPFASRAGCSRSGSSIRTKTDASLAHLQSDLESAYQSVVDRMGPNSTLYVAGYPMLFGADKAKYTAKVNGHDGKATAACSISGGHWIGYDDAQWINLETAIGDGDIARATADVNERLETSGSSKHVLFVGNADGTGGARQTFNQHGLCDDSASYINPLFLDSAHASPFQTSFHPNLNGQVAYARAFETTMRLRLTSF